MSNYITHAKTEFRAAGYIDENGKYCDEMQEAICEGVLKLLEVFHGEGHSGSSAPYAINMFSKLAKFEPIVPLTGEDWEWNDISSYSSDDMKYQNKRCSYVFKGSDGRAYDSQGRVFWEWYTNGEYEKCKSYFTSGDSRVYIEFPYTPTVEYVEREAESD
jgi:hypothetical protein